MYSIQPLRGRRRVGEGDVRRKEQKDEVIKSEKTHCMEDVIGKEGRMRD